MHEHKIHGSGVLDRSVHGCGAALRVAGFARRFRITFLQHARQLSSVPEGLTDPRT
jgi:hypothetical protein